MKAKLFSSITWTVAQSWGVQFISLLVFVVLARLLEPSAFGLMAMAGIYIHISGILVDQGLSAAIIQKKVLKDEHLDTAFWMNMFFGVVLTGGGWLLAEPVARLFGEPELTLIIKLLSFRFFLTSLKGVQNALLRRNFRFKLLAIRSLAAAVVGGVVGVGMAATGWGVMSLVGQQLATAAIGVALLWSVSGWRPGLGFVWSYAKELSSFGINIIGMKLLEALRGRSDDLLIGYFLGSVALGYYTIAYRLFKHLIDVLTKIISRVALPAFAALQSNPDELSRVFGRAIKLSSFLSFPVFAGLGILAADILPTLFGRQWSPSVPVMQALTGAGIVYAFAVLAGQLMIAKGRPSWAFGFLLVSTSVGLIGFFLAVPYGLVAVAAVHSAVYLVMLPAYMFAATLLIGFGWRDAAHYLRTSVMATFMMACVLSVVKLASGGLISALASLSIALVLGAVTYLGIFHLLEPEILGTVRDGLRRKPKTRRSPSFPTGSVELESEAMLASVPSPQPVAGVDPALRRVR